MTCLKTQLLAHRELAQSSVPAEQPGLSPSCPVPWISATDFAVTSARHALLPSLLSIYSMKLYYEKKENLFFSPLTLIHNTSETRCVCACGCVCSHMLSHPLDPLMQLSSDALWGVSGAPV